MNESLRNLSNKEKLRLKVGVNSGLVIDRLYMYSKEQILKAGIDKIKEDGGKCIDLVSVGVEDDLLKKHYSQEEI
jgi:hypothetical protein